jgi:hypothetical protein
MYCMNNQRLDIILSLSNPFHIPVTYFRNTQNIQP